MSGSSSLNLGSILRLIRHCRNSSFIYVVLSPPQVFDGCRSWIGGLVSPVTMTYPPSAMSTLSYQPGSPPATKSFNFADLPCPPSAIADTDDTGALYSPVLVSNFRTEINSYGTSNGLVFDTNVCEIAAVVDPPVRAVRVGSITEAGDDVGGIP